MARSSSIGGQRQGRDPPYRKLIRKLIRSSEDIVGVILILVLQLGSLIAQTIDILHLEYFVHAIRIARGGGQAAVAIDQDRADARWHRQRAQWQVLEHLSRVVHPDRQGDLGAELAVSQ